MQNQNESLLKDFVSKCDQGVFTTAAAAIQQASIPHAKTTKPFLTYEGPLELGDPKRFSDSSISIDVRRYFKTKTAKPPSSSFCAIRKPTISEATIDNRHPNMHGDVILTECTPDYKNISLVRNVRTYKVNDPSCPGGKLDVELKNLVRGYKYGSEIVPITAVDADITKFETIPNFTIIGFIPFDKV